MWMPTWYYEMSPYIYIVVSTLVLLSGTGFGKLMGVVLLLPAILILHLRHRNRARNF